MSSTKYLPLSWARSTAGGGAVLNGPMEVPGGAWIIQASDPQGAMFALIQFEGERPPVRRRPLELAPQVVKAAEADEGGDLSPRPPTVPASDDGLDRQAR